MTPLIFLKSGFFQDIKWSALETFFFDEKNIYDASHLSDFLHFLSTKSLGENNPYKITKNMRSALSELDTQDKKFFLTFLKDWLPRRISL